VPRTHPHAALSPIVVVCHFRANLSVRTSSFVPHSNLFMMVMDIRSADARVCGLYENLMASESWSGDRLSNDRATESAGPSLEAERHIKSMSILNSRGEQC
jgi:hypothetical protein